MTLAINDTTMTSDQSVHIALHAPDRSGWEVSWLPGDIDRQQAPPGRQPSHEVGD